MTTAARRAVVVKKVRIFNNPGIAHSSLFHSKSVLLNSHHKSSHSKNKMESPAMLVSKDHLYYLGGFRFAATIVNNVLTGLVSPAQFPTITKPDTSKFGHQLQREPSSNPRGISHLHCLILKTNSGKFAGW